MLSSLVGQSALEQIAVDSPRRSYDAITSAAFLSAKPLDSAKENANEHEKLL